MLAVGLNAPNLCVNRSSGAAFPGTLATASFILPFPDLGSGQVGIDPQRGGVVGTFTRATGASTVLANGLIGTVASGSPRSYYDPTTLAYLGYLAEGARTNVILRSEELDNASWAKTRSTVTGGATTSPDGTASADKVVEDATAANTHLVSQSITYAATTAYTMSVFLKAAERTWAEITMFDGVGSVGAFLNLATGALGTVVGTATSTVKAYPNGWYRLTLTFTTAGGAGAGNAAIFIAEADNDVTFDGNGTSGIFAWGAQVEAASFASSYIATVGTTVTRNADVLTYPGTGWLSQTAGTLFHQVQKFAAGVTMIVAQIDDGTGNESIQTLYNSSDLGTLNVADGGASQVAINTVNTLGANVTGKLAATYALNDFGVVLNGGAVVPDTTGTLPTTTTLRISGSAGGSSLHFGPIRRLAYFPSRLSNAQLQAMTS